MGIPSYFKRLTDSIPGLVSSRIEGPVTHLLFDFNCIVYGCLRSAKLPVFQHETRGEWEAALCEEICEEVVRLWTVAGKPSHVFIAVDGVVPMAKIKQQRMRRFKSVWLAAQEAAHGVRNPEEPRWDTNAITPGTEFMGRLGARLQKLCASRKWHVSTSDGPGEGEHKVMAWLRAHRPSEPGAIVIYGLDADLILLAALAQEFTLTAENRCYLFREAAEFGGGRGGGSGSTEKSYLYLSIPKLIESLCGSSGSPTTQQFLLDYCVGMSLLGNDFLPHGLLMRIRDGGHDVLLAKIREFESKQKWLVDRETLTVNWETLKEFLAELAKTEDADLVHAIQKKKRTRPMVPRNEAERLMEAVQKLPLEWFVEREFLHSDGSLRDDWMEVYRVHVPPEAVAEYQRGLQWILDYYMGNPVNCFWFYPWHLPPLFSDLVTGSRAVDGPSPPQGTENPLQPAEQLAMVLPLESWHLIANRKLRAVPSLLPQFWPSRFEFMSHGRLWMWECEADIPILTPGRLRSVVSI